MKDIPLDPLSGFRDFLPSEAAARNRVISKALAVGTRFGYHQIDTPSLEREAVLAGKYGDEGDSLRYRFQDHGKRDVGLRYDLTVPFSRYIARFYGGGAIKFPFRRSHAAPVWRADHAQAGRYREFIQCDFDIAGSANESSDVEVLQLTASVLRELGLTARIHLSHRQVLEDLLTTIEVSSESRPLVYGILDRYYKVEHQATKESLEASVGARASEILMSLLSGATEEKLSELLAESDAYKTFASILSLYREAAVEGIEVVIDLSIVRGLSYYTGLVFESYVHGAESLGSVMSGGRYDGIVGSFLGRDVAAVGTSVGVDRVLAVYEKLETPQPDDAKSQVCILPMSTDDVSASLGLAQTLRAEGISTVVYTGKEDALSRLLGYAEGVARAAVIVGSRERESGNYSLRNLENRTQETIRIESLVETLKSL